MKNSIRPKPSSRQKLRMRFMLISGATMLLLTFTMGWLVFLNITLNVKIKATANGNGGSMLSNGEIVGSWKNEEGKWKLISGTCNLQHSATDGDYISSSPIFNSEGIDVSIDYKRRSQILKESSKNSSNQKTIENGSFFTRGKSLDFGFKKGLLTISYKIANAYGGNENISDKTNYQIPTDEQFRNYRFIYTPTTGRAEIFVNNVIVWSHQGTPNTPMYWTDAGNMTIAKGIVSDQPGEMSLNNLIIRTINTVSPFAESLISFSLENAGEGILLHWSTIVNGKVSYFALERSSNGIDFSNINNFQAESEPAEFAEYTYEDKVALPSEASLKASTLSNNGTVVFYRIHQVFKDGKNSADAISAIKIRANKALAIDRINPERFETSFNITYYTPSSGRVWIELMDENGKIKSTETFEAQQGKNIYFYQDKKNLSSGNYVVNLIQNDKRVSAKVTKM